MENPSTPEMTLETNPGFHCKYMYRQLSEKYHKRLAHHQYVCPEI